MTSSIRQYLDKTNILKVKEKWHSLANEIEFHPPNEETL